jgi:tRNA (guanine-N7-)-methyltransferase
MRLRHRKWSGEVIAGNKDIGESLDDLDPKRILGFTDLEIGCGLGGFLLTMSKDHPERTYLGVEINLNAFAMAVKKGSTVKDSQKNFLILHSPIERLLPLFQDNQLDHIYINFPDPWPKKKQHHRRLTYPPLLKEYDRILRPDGMLCFRTDNAELYQDSLGYLRDSGFFDLTTISPFYSEKADYLPATEYETKFRAQGVTINVILATKKK